MSGAVGSRQPLSAGIQLIEHVEFVIDVISDRKLLDCSDSRAGVSGILDVNNEQFLFIMDVLNYIIVKFSLFSGGRFNSSPMVILGQSQECVVQSL